MGSKRALIALSFVAAWPALATGQGRELGPEPAETWEGRYDYTATAASLISCRPGACGGTNCNGSAAGSSILDDFPETPGLSIVHARLMWAALAPENQNPDAEVTLTPPGGAPTVIPVDNMLTESFQDALSAQECSLVATLCGVQPSTCGFTFYAAYADVTDVMRDHLDAGNSLNGEYTVGDVDVMSVRDQDPNTMVASLGSLMYGAWSLLVVYEDPQQGPLRRIYYYQGHELAAGLELNLRPRGFRAPPDPQVDMTIMVLEGDADKQGDSLSINGRDLTNNCNPRSNAFNSTVSSGRADGSCRQNVTGVDLDKFTISDAVEPLDTEAEVSIVAPRGDGLLTPGDQLLTAWLVIAFDHQPANLDALKNEKGARPPSGSTVVPGEQIEYSIIVQNDGGDFAENVTVTDRAPDGTLYVPGSAVIDVSPLPDGPGGTNPFENGLNLSLVPGIGLIEPGERHTVRFRVEVEDGVPLGTELRNVAIIGADGLDDAETEPVLHTVGEGEPPPPPDAGMLVDALPPPPVVDAMVDEPEPPATGGDMDASGPPPACPAGEEIINGECQPNPCGEGQVLDADGVCKLRCQPPLVWDGDAGPTGAGQCVEGGGDASSDGCGCDAGRGATPASALLLALLVIGVRPRRRG